MIISFSELTENARVWIYPSSRKFYDTEIPDLKTRLDAFVTQWLENEASVGVQIFYNRFLVFGADLNQTIETTKIDELVSFIFSLQSDYDIELLDKMNVCFKQGEFVQYKDLKEFKKLIKQKSVSKKTIIFDNLVSNIADYTEVWEIPITESWYNRFF